MCEEAWRQTYSTDSNPTYTSVDGDTIGIAGTISLESVSLTCLVQFVRRVSVAGEYHYLLQLCSATPRLLFLLLPLKWWHCCGRDVRVSTEDRQAESLSLSFPRSRKAVESV